MVSGMDPRLDVTRCMQMSRERCEANLMELMQSMFECPFMESFCDDLFCNGTVRKLKRRRSILLYALFSNRK